MIVSEVVATSLVTGLIGYALASVFKNRENKNNQELVIKMFDNLTNTLNSRVDSFEHTIDSSIKEVFKQLKELSDEHNKNSLEIVHNYVSKDELHRCQQECKDKFNELKKKAV